MATTIITRDDDGGSVSNTGAASWILARDAASGIALQTLPLIATANMIYVREIGSTWGVVRQFQKFDLSGILAGATITAAQINYEVHVTTGAGFSMYIQESSYGTLSLDDFSNFTGPILGSAAAGGSGSQSLSLNSLGLAYLESKIGGFAELCFRDSGYDYDDVDPAPGGYHRINTNFDDSPQTTLEITYIPIGVSIGGAVVKKVVIGA